MSLDRGSGHVVLGSDRTFNGVKVFSASMFQQREQLGERVTAWIAANPGLRITEFVVTQSSDAEYHMLAISVFFVEPRSAS